MYDRGGMRNEGLVGLPRGSYRAMSAVHVLCFVFAILHLIFIIKTPCLRSTSALKTARHCLGGINIQEALHKCISLFAPATRQITG
jgi:hypothetical protein